MRIKAGQTQFADGVFEFWAIVEHDTHVTHVIRVRSDNTPLRRAREKGITGHITARPASRLETALWFHTHPERKVTTLDGD